MNDEPAVLFKFCPQEDITPQELRRIMPWESVYRKIEEVPTVLRRHFELCFRIDGEILSAEEYWEMLVGRTSQKQLSWRRPYEN
jgi:hypothetical protein